MHLYLSSSKPWRADYSDDRGVVLYRAEAPRVSFGGETISISKLQPDSTYDKVAEVEYHSTSLFGGGSRIRIGNTDIAAKQFLRKGHWKFTAKTERNFQGPDGQQYVWKMSSRKCKLLHADSDVLVAIFDRKHYGLLSHARPPTLEILPDGHRMADLIITTFVYMEKLRVQEESAAAAAGG